ncbi:ASKHA domain-containing protein [Sporomusa sphaeroides DSM 2875]|uniref:ASKHA domain-containing protein n=1 Tax=Sporomusa sphaeroides TaxID=47679 RepID=UPI00202E2630|nr:ASKHA domain-containing protein [Sporomusa sphaeroides]MCM0759824.1 ASKHA domain-containing protein [Sporomusa sphaeroides DSM 2875]
MNTEKRYKLLVEGSDRVLACSRNQTVLQSLIAGGVFVEANCGGRGTCGKCKLQVTGGQVAGKDRSPVEPDGENSYLACRIYPQTDITICLKQAGASQKGQTAEIVVEEGSPLISKVVLTPVYPTVEQHYSLQDMLAQALAARTGGSGDGSGDAFFATPDLLRRLDQVAAEKPVCITLTLLDRQVIAIEAGDTAGRLYGVAFDIGTTTVVGMLVDVSARKVVAVSSRNNPQASMGADVISRIQATHELEGGLERLSQLIRHCLNQIVADLCAAANIVSQDIYAVTIAGNATMAHLVLEISPSTLVRKPYAALFKYIASLSPQEIELAINPQGKIIVLPGIASFIGSDTTAAIVAVDQDRAAAPLLLVDLGTNGEMVIGDGRSLYACSTAAGPAFEGAHIRDGMRAAEGAITDVVINRDEVVIRAIGHARPAGICGSGIVKAVAELVKHRIINAGGRFDKAVMETLPAQLRQRLKNQDGQWEFVLVNREDSATGTDISITQADVRQIQLVKSSICTGIQFLFDRVDADRELKVYLAGAFGNYIDIDSALTIGLLPGIRQEQVFSAGNAAGTGAVQALLSRERKERCIAIAAKTGYVELAAQPGFQQRFLENLNFPQR